MGRKIFLSVLAFFLFHHAPVSHAGEMTSSNYQITTSVLSGGGEYMISDNFDADLTLAQPSPFIESDNRLESTSYVLYTGFWYTLATAPEKSKAMPWIPLLLLDD